jgi:hypothetical protein
MVPRDGNQGIRLGSPDLLVGRRNGRRAQPEHSDSRRAAERPTLRVALMDVSPEHRRILEQVCISVGYSPVFCRVPDTFAGRLDPLGDLAVVECDLGFGALHLAERVRSAGMCPVCVLLNWWSDLEREAHQAADFVLHVPLTPTEVREVLSSTIYPSDAIVAAVTTGEEIVGERAEANHRVPLSQSLQIRLTEPARS